MRFSCCFEEYAGSKKTFFSAFRVGTDAGICCIIMPYLNFVNNNTVDWDPMQYSIADWHNVPRGVESGLLKGLRIVLGSILQNSISDKFSSSSFGQIYTQKQHV
jgi:hypothetical protein